MKFEFATATRILYGPGVVREVPGLAAEMGKRPFLVIGRSAQRASFLLDALQPTLFHVSGEPTVEVVQQGVAEARAARCDVVLGLGGGSVLDTAKAIAALLANEGTPLDYLEVVGRGQALKRPSAPFIAIPTTAGTGSEVTSNAVLGVTEHRQKVSLRSPFMLPRLAVVDPELTYSLPPSVTASTGLDALTQVIEPFVSNKANPLTDAICREGIRRAGQALRRAYEGDKTGRDEMALVSLFGGLALSNAKLGAVHGFAGPIGGMFPAPHGMICARLLPFVMEANIRALQDRVPDSAVLPRYDEVAQLLTGKATATAIEGVAWVQDVCRDLQVPPLSQFGVTTADIPALIPKSQAASSMKGNPIPLTDEALTEILQQAL